MSNPYDEAYFMRGKETGKSLYTNYRWLPELSIPMVQRMVAHLGIGTCDTILDFGCARGYTVKALRQLGYEAYGEDISDWAIQNADEEAVPFVTSKAVFTNYDWIVAKDVLEHIPYAKTAVGDLMDRARVGVFAVVPLSMFDRAAYVISEYEWDVTHVQRLTLPTWAAMFMRPGWRVEASYRVVGIKDNYARPERGWERGNGFLTARRM